MDNKYIIYVDGGKSITYWDLATAIQTFRIMCSISKSKHIIDLIDGQTGEVLDSTTFMRKEI